MVEIDTGWRILRYGEDLDWCATEWADLVDPGVSPDGYAYLAYRRTQDWTFAKLSIQVGETTVFPNTGPWYFEMPAELFASTGDDTLAPSLWEGVASAWHLSGALGGGEYGSSLGVFQAAAAGGPDADRPTLGIWFPGWDGGAGQVTSEFPFAWADSDYALCSIMMPAYPL